MSKRRIEAKWKISKSKQVPGQVSGKVTTVLQNLKEMHKEERLSMDCGSESRIQENEKANSRTTHTNRTYGKGGTYCLPCGSQRNRERKFIVERPEDDSPAAPMEVEEELLEPWTLFTDKSSCIDGSGAGLIITNPERIEFTYALRFRFDATNNEAEYEALIVVPKESKNACQQFQEVTIKQVPRSENKKVDTLSKIASTSFAHQTKQVLVEELKEKSINEAEVLEKEGNTWMTPIYEYLTKEILPAESKKARAIRLKSRRYVVIDGVLYKKSFLEPWLRCVGPLQANYVIREIYEGSCNMHAGPRNLQQKLTPITSPWPFYKWGIDIAGPFSEGPDKVKFLIVAMDYFTKWIKAKPVTAITGTQIKKFVWDNIVCSALPPSSIRKPTAWWKEQTEVWEKE
ncbi:reverse transcriptase domain-containing protein [Tanacetum coccineum]